MSSIVIVLAQLNALEEFAPAKALGKTGGMLMRDILLIVGAILVLSVMLIIWARSPSRRSRQRRHGSGTSSSRSAETVGGSREHRHHRRRRQRRDHRGRNPTLEETGGLPPMRNESSAPPHS